MKKNRIYKLLAFLLNQVDYLSAKDIADHFHVSVRTIYNDVDSIKFKQLLHGSYIDKKPKIGIKLIADGSQKNNIQKVLDQFSFHYFNGDLLYDDETNILLILFTHSLPVTLDFISEQLYMSKTTLESALNNSDKWLKSFEVCIERRKNSGLTLVGREDKIRQAFKELCFHFRNSKSNISNTSVSRIDQNLKTNLDKIFSPKIVNEVTAIVNKSEINLNEAYTDFDYANMITKLCILVLRNKMGMTVTSSHHFSNDIREQLVAQLINLQLETTFHLKLSDDELNETTYSILTTRRQNNNLNLSYGSSSNKVIDQFTKLISTSLNIDLNHDQELKINLLNHLNPAIRRIRYGIKIENPLLTQIKYEYTSVYIAVMTSIEEIEKDENIVFDADELGYICLHIVAAINRSTNKRTIATGLICEGGLTISTYLKSKIEKQFNELSITKSIPLSNFNESYIRDVELVLNATNNRFKLNKNIISISPIFDEHDQYAIRSWLLNYEYKKIIHKDVQIRNNILFFKDDLQEKNQLIEKYCKFLEIDNYVSSGFITSVLNREKRAPTSLGRGIAVPHGSGALVKRSVIMVILLEKPIPWDKQLVDLVFLIAINFKESKRYRYFFEKLFYIVSDNDMLTSIKKASSPSELESIIFDSTNYKKALNKPSSLSKDTPFVHQDKR